MLIGGGPSDGAAIGRGGAVRVISRKHRGGAIVAVSLAGALFLLAGVMTAVVSPASGVPQLPPVQAQLASSSGAATTTTACSGLNLLLGLCSTTTTTPGSTTSTLPPSTTTTACSGLNQLLGLCSTTTTTVPPTTTTSTTAPTGNCAGTVPPVSSPGGAWACTFDDEFNGTAFDPTYWQPALTSNSDFSTGTYPHQVCYVNNSNTVSESGGSLNLTVLQVPQTNCPGMGGGTYFQSDIEGGGLMTYQLFSQEYGYFQVRAELPASTIAGLQETLWMYPEDETKYGGWPDSGEIDYGEFYSQYPNNDIPVVHYPGSGNDPNATNDYCTLANTPTAGQFNTYALM